MVIGHACLSYDRADYYHWAACYDNADYYGQFIAA
jgi:hypothetical protein